MQTAELLLISPVEWAHVLQVGHANPPTLLLAIASMARSAALALERGSQTPEEEAELEFLNTGAHSEAWLPWHYLQQHRRVAEDSAAACRLVQAANTPIL